MLPAGTETVDEHFATAVLRLRPGRPAGDPVELLAIFDAQVASRQLDLAARRLRAVDQAFYTIGSAGHEGNAAVAAALRVTDPALLHYRSGGFYLRRAMQLPGHDGVRDIARGLVASASEPIAGGRHKVFGHHALAVIPQTSTIASHLPRAVGVAFAIERARRLGLDSPWPVDALAVCSFGDASANHSSALGAINNACQGSYQGLPLPLLFVCEDNGIGVSVRTPAGWIAANFSHRPTLEYFPADGCDPVQTLHAAAAAAAYVRGRRRPAFLHLSMVRLMGHAGSDAEIGYRSAAEISADYARDPLLRTAARLVDTGQFSPDQLLARYRECGRAVLAVCAEVGAEPTLASAAQIMAPLAPRRPPAVAAAVAPAAQRASAVTLAQAINAALADILEAYPEATVFGEDVARKGGVYGVTRGLHKRFGARRVFDTVLDEQTILGLALGMGVSGMLPIPEIQYLAYLHNAADQIRGEAATLQYFSTGNYRNPLVVRIAGYAYQKGFGGHFHNDNSVAALRDIPGVIVAVAALPDDAAAMLRTCAAAARADGSVCLFTEPIALYHIRDLHSPGDNGWLAHDTGAHVPVGAARLHGAGTDVSVITFGNGLFASLRVARRLAAAEIDVRVLDLRWLAPLDTDAILTAAEASGRVLVVDETRRSGGVSESVITALVDRGFTGRIARVASEDSFVPLGAAANRVLVDEEQIEAAIRALL